MRISNIRHGIKIRVCYIAIILTAVFVLYGCGEKNNDLLFIETLEESKGDISDIPFARELNVPQSINLQLDVDTSELNSIYISDEEIEVPDVSAMYTLECDRVKLDEMYKRRVSENIFSDSVIYIYDGTLTKYDCEYYIEYYETMADRANKVYRVMYEEEIEKYEEKEKNAPNNRNENIDFSSNQYIGMIEGQQYLLTFRADGDYVASVELELYPAISLGDFINADKGIEVSCLGLSKEDFYSFKSYDYDELITKTNECIYDIDEAMVIASEYINSVMSLEASLIYAKDLGFALSDYVNDTTFKIDGYNMTYIPEIEGVMQYTSDLYYIDYLQKENKEYIDSSNEDSEIAMTNGSIMQVAVSSKGIIGMECDMPMEKRSELKKADLLSWDEIITALEASIDDYYTKHKTAYLQINFNSIELSYYPKETDTGFIYVPVWVFAEIDKDINEPVQLILLDAQTGEIVEVK